jgi:hypothetical protein
MVEWSAALAVWLVDKVSNHGHGVHFPPRR